MIAVFPNIAILENTLPLPSGTLIGVPLQSTDGRVAICHPFGEEDLAMFTGMEVQVLDKLPEDWQWPEKEEA